MIRIHIESKDDDALTLLEVTQEFKTDKQAEYFLSEFYRTKMQNLFNKLGVGKFTPGRIMKGTSLPNSVLQDNPTRYDDDGNPELMVAKKPLYDEASKICFEKTSIKIETI